MKAELPNHEQIRSKYEKINHCLNKVAPVVLRLLVTTFKDNNIDYKLMGKGLDLKYELRKNKLSSAMFLHNLFIEIATTDRDLEPLRYDYRLDNPAFLLNRVLGVVASKVAPILPLMDGINPKDVEKIAKSYHPNYERFNIALLNGNNMSQSMIEKIEKGFMP
jgi:hypothetical protein